MDWKDSPDYKPLVLLGARQVGKTYILEQFAKENFKNFITCNFEKDLELHSLFARSLEPSEIVKNLELYFGTNIVSTETLVIFDEIQECPRALTSLKYFAESRVNLHVAAAGSLLGVAHNSESSFPVGKINLINIFPLSFREFMLAVGEEKLMIHLQSWNPKVALVDALHHKLLELVRIYIIVGGMPEVINLYLKGDTSFTRVRNAQKELNFTYQRDFSKHATKAESIAISALWQSIPEQLSKEVKRFYFSKVKNYQTQQLKAPLQWLIHAGLALKCAQLKTTQVPFAAFAHPSLSKLYLHDVGMLSALVKLNPQLLLSDQESLFTSFRGALAENFVAQELKVEFERDLYYWVSDSGGEIDFVFESPQGQPIALEVKAGENLKAKSLTAFLGRFKEAQALRVSAQNFNQNGRIHNFPLYAVHRLPL